MVLNTTFSNMSVTIILIKSVIYEILFKTKKNDKFLYQYGAFDIVLNVLLITLPEHMVITLPEHKDSFKILR